MEQKSVKSGSGTGGVQFLAEMFNGHMPASTSPETLAAGVEKVRIAETGSCAMRVYALVRLIDQLRKNALATGNTKTVFSRVIIDEDHYARPIATARKLQDSFGFSETFNAWIEGRRQDLVATMRREKPASLLAAQWRAASMDGRLALLDEAAALHSRVYGAHAVPFERTPVSWRTDMPAGVSGATFVTCVSQVATDSGQANLCKDIKVLAVSVGDIGLNYTMFRTLPPERALQTIHHENTHALVGRLGAAAVKGEMGQDHLLHGDAVNANMREVVRAAFREPLDMFFPSLYRGDVDEKMCLAQQEAFAREYFEP